MDNLEKTLRKKNEAELEEILSEEKNITVEGLDLNSQDKELIKEQYGTFIDSFVREELRQRNSYTLTGVIKNPLRSALNEIIDDLTFTKYFQTWKRSKEIGLTLASFALIAPPHELIHAGVNKLFGGENKEIVINTLYGGSLWEKIIPGIESKVLFPLLGGYVLPGEYNSTIHELATLVSPYLLTPLGIYSVLKGKEKDSLALRVLGSGLIAGHAGGILGDWRRAGTVILEQAAQGITNLLGTDGRIDETTIGKAALIIGGFYAGYKLMNFSYRLMKGTINTARNYFSPD
ncbi:hypothetical protein J4479_03445 [Candidatus Woesearchaeota archaeon]|nr:hypothetical protein [Candidatus Woesearchaeota archaeon]